MAKDKHPQPHRFTGDLSSCGRCSLGPLAPIHRKPHAFAPAGDDSYRDVPEFCRCGLPESHKAIHGDPRPEWMRGGGPVEPTAADRVPALLSDAWDMPE